MNRTRATAWTAGVVVSVLLALVALVSPQAKTRIVLLVMNLFVILLVLTSLLTAAVLIFSTIRFFRRIHRG